MVLQKDYDCLSKNTFRHMQLHLQHAGINEENVYAEIFNYPVDRCKQVK